MPYDNDCLKELQKMINSVIVAVTLIAGHVHINNVYPYDVDGVSINTALNECKVNLNNKSDNQHCYLLQQRDNKTLVFSDLDTYQQIIVEKDK